MAGHAGELVLGELEGKRVLCMAGRFHPYEGHHMSQVRASVNLKEGCRMSRSPIVFQCVLPIRVMKELGVEVLLVTNAVGGINRSFQVHPVSSPNAKTTNLACEQTGDLMVIQDHIALPLLSLRGPLVGPNDEGVGPRFPSLNAAYDPALRTALHKAAAASGLSLREGVYFMASGPQYETPAELRMLQALGADAVGQSPSLPS